MPMGLQSTSTRSTQIIGGGACAIEASPVGKIKSQFKLCVFLRNTVLSGAVIGITTIRCISNTVPNFLAGERRRRDTRRRFFLARSTNFLHESWVLRGGAPEEIRTPDPQIRSLVLYPAELRARLAIRCGEEPITAIRPNRRPWELATSPPYLRRWRRKGKAGTSRKFSRFLLTSAPAKCLHSLGMINLMHTRSVFGLAAAAIVAV